MANATQAQSFGDILIDGQGNSLVINQVIQIAVAEIKTRKLIASSPYLGLSRFEERHKDFFYGRDQLVGQLLQLLSQPNRHLVLLAGASGSGKSSVVRAGLLPQLGARLPQGRFRPLLMTPDRDPVGSLREALVAAGIARYRAATVPTDGDGPAVATALWALRPAEESWLLLVDQFEEVFTLCHDATARSRFLDALVRLATNEQPHLKIVLAMRADFFDRFGPHPEFAKLTEKALCLVPDMQPSELRAAIEQPAAQNGVVYEEGLVGQIIADVQGQPGALPLLQYTLDLLWQEDNPVDDRTLNTANYHRLGGIEGALKLRADTLYRFADGQKQTPRSTEQQEAMRHLFLHLVDLTGQGAEARAVSKRAPLSEFTRGADPQLLAELIEEKLLVSNAEPRGGDRKTQGAVELAHEALQTKAQGTVELAHEALLSAWSTLKDWIEQGREVIYVRNRLRADAQKWQQVQAGEPARAEEELWGGSRLQRALELREGRDFQTILGGLLPDEESFLSASAGLRDRRQKEESERREQLTRLQLEKQQQRTRLLRRGIAASLSLALVACVLGGFAVRQTQLARRQTQLANQRLDQAVDVALQIVLVGEQRLIQVAGASEARRDLLALSRKLLATLNAPGHSAADHTQVWRLFREAELILSNPHRGEQQVEQATRLYEQARTLAEAQLQKDPRSTNWQRDLSVSYHKLGGVLETAGKLPEATRRYEESLAIAQKLAEADPNNTQWQRDLSASLERLGGVLEETASKLPEATRRYEESLAIAQKLAKADPNNTDWQRDLSISFERLGRVLEKADKLPEATRRYEESLALRKKLAEADPNNTDWQRDLLVSYGKLGGVLEKAGKLPEATKYYEQDVALAKRLAALDPANMSWQYDLLLSHISQILFAERRNDHRSLVIHRDAAHALVARFDREGLFVGEEQLDRIRAKLQELSSLKP